MTRQPDTDDARNERVVAFRRRRRRPAAAEEGPADAAERRLRVLTRTILGVGFGAALVVYVIARARPANPLGYDPLDTKQYVHDLQLYGGTANVLAAEFRDWFTGLWYGRNLAYTIAALTVLVVLIVRFYVLTSPTGEEEAGGQPPGPRRPVA